MSTPAAGVRRARATDSTRERTILLYQLLLCATVLLASALIATTGQASRMETLLGGLLIVFVATGVAIMVPWNRVPLAVSALLPVSDIIAIAMLRESAPSAGLAMLWAFPVMWIAAAFGVLGVVLSVLGTTLLYWGMVLTGSPEHWGAETILLPLVLAALSTASYLSARRAFAQRIVLDKQSLHLQHSVDRARRQEDLVTDVLDAVDFGVIRITPEGALVVTNEAHARLQRSSAGAAKAYGADGLTRLEDEQLPLARARRGELFENELVWYGDPGDDGRRALRSTARRIVDSELSDAGTIVVTRDVTTEELALRAREDLVASVSHELRTPLTSITGYVELALDTPDLPPGARRSLEVAERNAGRLLELVSDILTVSAVSRKGVDLSVDASETDLAPVVQAAIEAAAPRAAERRITIDGSGVEETIAFADPHRIRQVVDNLIMNAINYNRDGGQVEVGASHDGLHAWLFVRDNGPGVSEAEVPRLFDRFFRSDSVRKTTTHGSGLGLAISRDIVRAHGGEITVQTRLGEGATFIVRLPSADPREVA